MVCDGYRKRGHDGARRGAGGKENNNLVHHSLAPLQVPAWTVPFERETKVPRRASYRNEYYDIGCIIFGFGNMCKFTSLGELGHHHFQCT